MAQQLASAPVAAPVAASGSIDDATIAEIEEQMTGDGVWIDPAFAREHGIGPEQERQLEQVVARTDAADLRVVLADVDIDDARFSRAEQLVAWLQDDLGGEATWLLYDYSGLDLVTYGEQPDPLFVATVARIEHPDDLVAQSVRIGELLQDGDAQEVWNALPEGERYGGGDSDGGVPAWGFVTGVLVAALALWAVGRRWLRRRSASRPGVAAAADRGFVLPTAVLRGVREAEDRQLLRTAEQEVLALGEAIAVAAPDAGGRSTTTWQAALDHYAAARSVLDKGTTPADVVGALVLARRGEAARRAAAKRRPWAPSPGCFFNPLHSGPVVDVETDGELRASVPACRACAASVERDEEPRDVLDFMAGGSTQHYFRLPLGVWSGTGYGSLEPDLLGALVRGAVEDDRPRRARKG